jgi:hypothetical protein
MNIILCIILVTVAYCVGVHVGQRALKSTCPGIIKMARDEEDNNAYYCALEVKDKDSLKEMYESDTVTFEVRRMPETQIKQGL